MKTETILLGFRKILACATVLVVGVVFQSLGMLSETFSLFLLGLLGIYVGGNVGAKFGKKS